MRRRRAERLVLRAEAAADNGFVAEAREALAEARQLVPTLSDLDRLEHKLSTAAEPSALVSVAGAPGPAIVAEPPAAEPAVEALPESRAADFPLDDLSMQDVPGAIVGTSSGWKRTLTALAAMLVLLAAGGLFVFMLLGPGGSPLTTRDLSATAPLIDARALASAVRAVESPKPAPLPDVAPIEPTGTTGVVEDPRSAIASPASTSATDATRIADALPPARLVNVSLPSADLTPSGDVKPAAAPAPSVPPPSEPAQARVERVEMRETPDPPKLPVTAIPETRLPESSPPPSASPPAAPPPASPAPTTASSAVVQDSLVKTVLDRYAAAYSNLDADAAQRVWPGVNRGALARAFDGLASQRVSLGTCRIDVTGARALARCTGWTTWQPKVGGGEPRTDQRTWTFDLAKAGEAWQIVNARVQNR
jgi:hypothetical protein